MKKLIVFDPPMCCATGICGNSVDPTLVTFASDLEWLKKQGVDVVRHGLSFEPAEFVKNEAVKATLQKEGNNSLPIIVVADEIVSKGCYPSREKLAEFCHIPFNEEEAPPVHREENCCCGVDCDCSAGVNPKTCSTPEDECDCTNAPAEDNCFCGPDCDCHKSNVSKNFKKILFLIILTIIVIIIASRFCCKAGAVENSYKIITSMSQINTNEEVAFIYIPTENNEKISAKTKNAMLSAQNTLKSKNINASLYIINPKSSEYPQIASKTAPPAILTIYKGKNKDYVTSVINQTRLLQSYMATTRESGCGADCPCHRK